MKLKRTASFCLEALASPSICNVISDHFIFWVGFMDSTLEEMIKSFLGTTKYPFLAVVANLGVGMSILDILQGPTTSSEMMGRLLQLLDSHTPTLTKLKEGSHKRNFQRQIVEEQDREFQESLEIDKHKAKIRGEEEERLRQQHEKEEGERNTILQRKEQQRQTKLNVVPPEPAQSENTTTLMIRMLDGSRVQRRFLRSDSLDLVYTFIDTYLPIQIEDRKDYDLVSNFPRKTFSERTVTLKEASLYPQASLFVLEK